MTPTTTPTDTSIAKAVAAHRDTYQDNLDRAILKYKQAVRDNKREDSLFWSKAAGEWRQKVADIDGIYLYATELEEGL